MEKLYNNIVLPDKWPPRYTHEQYKDKQPVPYLENPPEVIDITVGRQLFVDDFLIEKTNLKPEYHRAKKFEGNPVMKPEAEWEKEVLPLAAPKSGGVWFDEEEKKFKMWYEASWLRNLAYAESEDGINWIRPELDVVPGTNKILPYNKEDESVNFWNNEKPEENKPDITYLRPDSNTVFIDYDTEDKSQRYKMMIRNPGGNWPAIVMTSPDGIHWENISHTFRVEDRSTIFYNPFRKKWIFSIRMCRLDEEKGWNVRARDYMECDDFLTGMTGDGSEAVTWLCADRDNKPNPYIGFDPQLYNVDAVAYESIMLGMFQIMYGPENNVCEEKSVPKITELIPMYSRDGFHFSRPSEKSIIQASLTEGSWDRGYVQSVGGICTIHGDELWIYYIGFGGVESTDNWILSTGMYGNGATGIAKLRRDGFVSMNTEEKGELLTRKLTFSGNKKYMLANFSGKLSAEIINEAGSTLARSCEITDDSTCRMIEFDDFDIASLNNEVFRIKFTLEGGKLYSFWFSDSKTGESGGYTAAGLVK